MTTIPQSLINDDELPVAISFFKGLKTPEKIEMVNFAQQEPGYKGDLYTQTATEVRDEIVKLLEERLDRINYPFKYRTTPAPKAPAAQPTAPTTTVVTPRPVVTPIPVDPTLVPTIITTPAPTVKYIPVAAHRFMDPLPGVKYEPVNTGNQELDEAKADYLNHRDDLTKLNVLIEIERKIATASTAPKAPKAELEEDEEEEVELFTPPKSTTSAAAPTPTKGNSHPEKKDPVSKVASKGVSWFAKNGWTFLGSKK